jgi:hypothetical protein
MVVMAVVAATRASFRALTVSSAARTPSWSSNRPPYGCEFRWDPIDATVEPCRLHVCDQFVVDSHHAAICCCCDNSSLGPLLLFDRVFRGLVFERAFDLSSRPSPEINHRLVGVPGRMWGDQDVVPGE